MSKLSDLMGVAFSNRHIRLECNTVPRGAALLDRERPAALRNSVFFKQIHGSARAGLEHDRNGANLIRCSTYAFLCTKLEALIYHVLDVTPTKRCVGIGKP